MGIHKDYIQTYVIWLKQDLQLSSTIDNLKQTLLSQLTNPAIFDKEITRYFDVNISHYSAEKQQGKIDQVQLFMKVINVLDDVENELKFIENIDLSRSTASIGAELVGRFGGTIEKFYNLVELINQAPNDLQPFVEPILNNVSPKLFQVLPSMQNISASVLPENMQQLGEMSANLVNALPSQSSTTKASSDMLIQQLFELPNYFNKINQAFGIEPGNVDSAKLMAKRDKAQQQISEFINAPKPSFAKLTKSLPKILAVTSDLCNTVHPLTKEAYLKGVKLLNELRHQHIPALIAETDLIERNFGLAKGSLSGPLLTQLNETYKQSADYVNQLVNVEGILSTIHDTSNSRVIAKAVNILGITTQDFNPLSTPYLTTEDFIDDLNVLQDDEFLRQRQAIHSIAQVNNSAKLAELQQAKESTQAFFNQVSNLLARHQNEGLNQIPPAEKILLANAYIDVQPHLASLDKELDKLIVKQLSLSLEERIQCITNAELSADSQKDLGRALNQSVQAAAQIIDSLTGISPETKQILHTAINVSSDQRSSFADAISSPPEYNMVTSAIYSVTGSAFSAVGGLFSAAVNQLPTSVVQTSSNIVDGISTASRVLQQMNDELYGQEDEITEELNAILEQKDAVTAKIDQSRNNYLYSTVSIAAQDALSMQQQKSAVEMPKLHLVTQPLSFAQRLEPAQLTSTQDHRHQIALFQNQEINLHLQKNKVNDFYAFLSRTALNAPNPSDLRLNQPNVYLQLKHIDKKQLYEHFQEIQPLLASQDPYGRRLENDLLEKIMDGSSTINDFLYYQNEITTYVDQKIIETRNDLTQLKQDLQQAKTKQSSQELEPFISQEKQPVTLFSSAANLNLDQKVKAFREDTLAPFLKNNLSQNILANLDIENQKLPYNNFHECTSTEATYEHLLNGMHYLDIGLTKLKELSELEKDPSKNMPTDLTSQGLKFAAEELLNVDWQQRNVVRKTTEMAANIYFAIYEFTEVKNQPQIKALANELLDLIKPLQDIPVINNNASSEAKTLPAENSIPKPSFIETWNKQMDVVQEVLHSPSPPHKLPATEFKTPLANNAGVEATTANADVPKEAEANALKDLSESLYKLTSFLEHQKDVGQGQLNAEQVGQMKAKASEQSEKLMKLFSGSFNGLNTASLSQQYLKGITQAIQDVMDVAHLGKEVIHARLQDIPNKTLSQLLQISDNAEINFGLKPGTISNQVTQQFSDFHVSLLANLGIDDEAQLHSLLAVSPDIMDERIENIRLIQNASSNGSNLNPDTEIIEKNLSRFKNMISNKADFSDSAIGRKNRVEFIETYEKLQPLLYKTSFSFTEAPFLRALRSHEDFSNACSRIVAQESKLNALSVRPQREIEQKQQLCENHIVHLQQSKNSFVMDLESQRLTSLKKSFISSDVNLYFDVMIKPDLGNTIFNNLAKTTFTETIQNEVRDDIYHLQSDLKQTIHQVVSDQIATDENSINQMVTDLQNLDAFYHEIKQLLPSLDKSNPYQSLLAKVIEKKLEVIENFSKSTVYDPKQMAQLISVNQSFEKQMQYHQINALIFNEMKSNSPSELPKDIEKSPPNLINDNNLKHFINAKISEYANQNLVSDHAQLTTLITQSMLSDLSDLATSQSAIESWSSKKFSVIDKNINNQIKLFLKSNTEAIATISEMNQYLNTIQQERQMLPKDNRSEFDNLKAAYLDRIENNFSSFKTLKDFQSNASLLSSIKQDMSQMDNRFKLLDDADYATRKLAEIEGSVNLKNQKNVDIVAKLKSHFSKINIDTIDTISQRKADLKKDLVENKDKISALPRKIMYKIMKRLVSTDFANRFFADRAQQELDKKVDSLIHNFPETSRKLITLLSEKKALTNEIISSIKNDLNHIADNVKSLCNIFDSLDKQNISIKDYGLDILKMDSKSIQHLERSISQSTQLGHSFSAKNLDTFMEKAASNEKAPTADASSKPDLVSEEEVTTRLRR